MTQARFAAFAAAACWLAAPVALADPAPRVNPTRDVDITYKVPVARNASTAILQRLRYSATLREQRVDLPTSGNWMVLNYTTHRMAMVRDESREMQNHRRQHEPAQHFAAHARDVLGQPAELLQRDLHAPAPLRRPMFRSASKPHPPRF